MPAFDTTRLADVHGTVLRAIDARDAGLFASLYTTTGALLPPDGRTVRGREAIGAEVQSWFDAGLVGQRLEGVDLTVGDRVAVEEGVAVGSFADGTEARSNYLVVHVRQDDGSWLMDRDIWTRVDAATVGGAY